MFRQFDPRFLFPGRDGNPRHSVGLGLIYPQELVIVALGVIFLFVKNRKLFFVVLLGLCVCLTPAALTQEAPHALRSLTSVPFYLVLTGAGFGAVLLTKKKSDKIFNILRSDPHIFCLYKKLLRCLLSCLPGKKFFPRGAAKII